MNHRSETNKLEMAVRFVTVARDTFEKDNPAKSDKFFDVMAEFRSRRISVAEVAARVKALFRDCPGLLASFNDFLPEQHKIQIRADEFGARVVSQT